MEEQDQVYVERPPESEKSVGSRILGWFLRFLFILLLGVGIGVGVYYGIPRLYRDFIQPVQDNTKRVAVLEENLEQLQADFLENQSNVSTRFTDVVGEVAGQREELAGLQAQTEGMLTRMDEAYSRLDEVQLLLDSQQAMEASLEDLGNRLSALEAIVEEETPLDHIRMQIELLRVMELVTRSRWWLVQDNSGKAVDDLTLAKEILMELNTDFQEDVMISSMIERLDQILFEIPLSPVIAADDLEIVWQYLILASAP
jgi:hypothetical protein